MSYQNDRPSSLENLGAIVVLTPRKRGKDLIMIPTSKPKTNKPKANIYPWCVVRLLPNLQRQTISCFHRRSDADGCVRAMRQMMPNVKHEIVFQSVASEEVETDLEADCLNRE